MTIIFVKSKITNIKEFIKYLQQVITEYSSDTWTEHVVYNNICNVLFDNDLDWNSKYKSQNDIQVPVDTEIQYILFCMLLKHITKNKPMKEIISEMLVKLKEAN